MIYINNTGKQNQVWLPKPYDVVSVDCPDVEEAYESGYTAGQEDCSGSTECNLQGRQANVTFTLSADTFTYDSGDYYELLYAPGLKAISMSVYARPSSGYDGLVSAATYAYIDFKGVVDDNYASGYTSGYTDGQNACSGSTTDADLIANLQGDYYVIPEGTTRLRNYAFGNACFSSITIPDSVTEIGAAAFSNNSCLTSITIPDSVQSVGYSAFWNCRGLLSVTIGSGLTGLSDSMFSAARSLTGITIPSNITSIGNGTFNTSGLTHMTFEGLVPPTLASISGGTASLGSTAYTFPIYVPCQSLQAYKTAFGQYYEPRIMCNSGETPSGTTELEIVYETSGANQTNWLFVGAAQSENSYFYQFYSAITLMVIDGVPVEKSPDNIHVSTVGAYDWYFYEFPTAGRHTVKYYLANDTTPARTLADVIFSDNLEKLHIVEAHIGEGYQYLHLGVFQGAAELTAVTLPNTLREIGPYTFEYSGIREITIPDSVTALLRDDGTFPYSGYGIFQACSALTSATIGTGVTKLPISTFDGCSALQTLTMNRTTPPELGNYCFKGCTSLQHIYVPASSVNAYKTASGWSDYASIISAKP